MIEFYGGYQVYSESGVDLTLLRENLRRPLAERWERAAQAAEWMEDLRLTGNGPPGRAVQERRLAMLDIPALLHQLSKHQVEYVLVGGLAMIAQGSAYVTKDLGICYSRTPQNIAAVVTALAPLHPYLRGAPPGLSFRFDAATIQAGLNFTLTTDLGDLDLLGEVSGLGGYEQVLKQSKERDVFGLKVRVLTLDGLIAAKKAAGRNKDQLHLLELEELKKLRDAGPQQEGGASS